ncbi:MAG: hypothetical protein H5T86_14230 [Armatimonadetes bacterium]|nr:hypothetical protein [Armatimonadota bacterium]
MAKPPAGVPAWRGIAPFDRLDEALKRKDEEASSAQVKARLVAQWLCLLVPLSVLCPMLQLLLWPEGDTVGPCLIAAEIMLLLWLLVAGIGEVLHGPSFRPAHWTRWIAERVRAELLRRDLALAWAVAGPYLRCANLSDMESVAERRVHSVNHATGDHLLEMIELREPGSPPWRDELEDYYHSSPAGAGFCPSAGTGSKQRTFICVRESKIRYVTSKRRRWPSARWFAPGHSGVLSCSSFPSWRHLLTF